MQIPGYRILKENEMIERGDFSRVISNMDPGGLFRTLLNGMIVSQTFGLEFYRPLPPIDSERTDTTDIDKICALLLMNFTDEVTINEKSADIAIRLLTRLKAVQEAIK